MLKPGLESSVIPPKEIGAQRKTDKERQGDRDTERGRDTEKDRNIKR